MFHARRLNQNDIRIQALGSTPNQSHTFTTMHMHIPIFSMLHKNFIWHLVHSGPQK